MSSLHVFVIQVRSFRWTNVAVLNSRRATSPSTVYSKNSYPLSLKIMIQDTLMPYRENTFDLNQLHPICWVRQNRNIQYTLDIINNCWKCWLVLLWIDAPMRTQQFLPKIKWFVSWRNDKMLSSYGNLQAVFLLSFRMASNVKERRRSKSLSLLHQL